MIEASQSIIIRDMVIIDFIYVCYILAYPFAGYPWLSFILYVAVLTDRIVCKHFIYQLSP